MPRRRTFALPLALLWACALLMGSALARRPVHAAQAAAASDPWMTRGNSGAFQAQRAADVALQIDLPKKDWMVLPASGSTLLVLASRKGDAVVMVEASELRHALDAADITDDFAQIEIDAIRNRHPKAADYQSRVITVGPRRLVAIQYSRFGVLGNERVRQYSMPFGRQLYRISCISAAAQFPLYDTMFSHIAASFTASE